MYLVNAEQRQSRWYQLAGHLLEEALDELYRQLDEAHIKLPARYPHITLPTTVDDAHEPEMEKAVIKIHPEVEIWITRLHDAFGGGISTRNEKGEKIIDKANPWNKATRTSEEVYVAVETLKDYLKSSY